jgi:homoserine O-acetyltransferase
LGVECNRLLPLEQQQRIAKLAPGARALRVVRSLHGHDDFLVEKEQLEGIVQESVGLAM